MHDNVLELFAARRGHFRFESGHHGDLWLEIAAAYVRPKRVREHAARLAKMLSGHRIEAVCGPMVEGALLAQMVAEELDIEFCFAEQFARSSSGGLFPIGYRVPAAFRTRVRGKRVAVVDDVINAGSAVRGAIEDLESCGARIVVIGSLMTLGDRASKIAAEKGASLETLATVDKSSLWTPAQCPLCASGVPLD
jgi:orotate phosphoribosyltransferase